MNSARTGQATDVVVVGAGGLFAVVDAFTGGHSLGDRVVNRAIPGSDLPGVPRPAFKISR